jgi:hypothetical protein
MPSIRVKGENMALFAKMECIYHPVAIYGFLTTACQPSMAGWPITGLLILASLPLLLYRRDNVMSRITVVTVGLINDGAEVVHRLQGGHGLRTPTVDLVDRSELRGDIDFAMKKVPIL